MLIWEIAPSTRTQQTQL